MTRQWTILLAAALAVAAVSAQAQQPAPAQPPPPAASPSPAPAEPGATLPAPTPEDTVRQLLEREVEPQPGDYTYTPGGRRDPFVSLLKPVEGTGKKGPRPVGMEGFLIQEVALKGIVKTKDGYISMIVGPDNKSYFCTVGQRMFDGAIVAMDQTSVTFRQELTDPLAPVKVREVKKSLYPTEEARQ